MKYILLAKKKEKRKTKNLSEDLGSAENIAINQRATISHFD